MQFNPSSIYCTTPTENAQNTINQNGPTENIPLKDRLEAFLYGAPNSEVYLYDSVRETAESLRAEILETLFTSEKLLHCSDKLRRDYEKTNSESQIGDLLFSSSEVYLRNLQILQKVAINGMVLETWKIRHDIGVLDFLKKVQDLGEIIWDSEEVTDPAEIHSLRLSINLFVLNHDCSSIYIDDILNRIVQLISIETVQSLLENSQKDYSQQKRSLPTKPTMTIEEIDEGMQSGQLHPQDALRLLNCLTKNIKHEKLANQINHLHSLHDYLENEVINDPAMIIYGAEHCLNYLADEELKQEKERRQEHLQQLSGELFNVLNEILPDEGCPIQ